MLIVLYVLAGLFLLLIFGSIVRLLIAGWCNRRATTEKNTYETGMRELSRDALIMDIAIGALLIMALLSRVLA